MGRENNKRIIDKFNEIQIEILNKGWIKTAQEYHPEFNQEHPEAMKLFQLYREIHDNMIKRLTIDPTLDYGSDIHE